MKRLTLCADDFGQSEAISSGILQLVAAGRLQAVSCLTESPGWPAMAGQLKALGTDHQAGLHFNLTHGFAAPGPRSAGFSPRVKQGPQAVGPLMLRAFLHQLDATSVRQRFIQQWQAFEAHYGQPPAFVDGHQHVHALPQIRRIVIEETRQRNPAAWLRVPHASGFLPKVLVMRAMTAALAASIKRAGLASNLHFGGFRPFRRDFDFAGFFRDLLAGASDATLVMCHPGLAADDATDPIAHCRQAELDYLLSDQFAADLAAANVSPGSCLG
ncbi:MAG: ChbG/HpnK family deacetylase [Verrucomicrobia bacterium]|nr:MAG: ChbG/HpnK family deacetylase [Verrucomicrobiota bacterium]